MKRTISILLALIMIFPFFSYQTLSADALGIVWVKEFYKDKFGDPTDQYYLTNKTKFEGAYSSDSKSDAKLGANLIFEREDDSLLAYIVLYHNGTDQLKNSTSSERKYDIYVKKTDGSQFTTSGLMQAGKGTIELVNTIDLANALFASSGEVKIYIEESYQENNHYLFAAKCGNFRELYDQEILTPYLEEQYQKAEDLLAQKKYDEADAIFATMPDYKDSSSRVNEAKKSDAYSEAEKLLAEKKYNSAAKAFEALGDYRDSAIRMSEAQALVDEAKKSFRIMGNTVQFGTYEQDNNTSNGKEPVEWIVLDVQEGKSLLLSKFAIDCLPYHTLPRPEGEPSYYLADTYITWETSTIRKWLNNDFLMNAFSPEELAAISITTVYNPDGDTDDKVFFLSKEEVNRLYKSDEDRICQPTPYAKDKGAYTKKSTGGCAWWLRTYDDIFRAMAVKADGKLSYDGYGEMSSSSRTVRPALCIDLESDFF